MRNGELLLAAAAGDLFPGVPEMLTACYEQDQVDSEDAAEERPEHDRKIPL